MPQIAVVELRALFSEMSMKELIRVHAYLGEAIEHRYVDMTKKGMKD